MIISCPACATRYVVPDSAIGLEGRTVRCAKCKHSWFQEGPELAEPIAAAYAAPAGGHAIVEATQAPATPRSPEPASADFASPPRQEVEAPACDGNVRSEDAEPANSPAWIDKDEAQPEVAPPSGAGIDAPVFDAASASQEWASEDPTADAGYDEVSQFEHEPPFRPRRNWVRWLTWGAGAFAVLALAAVAAMSAFGTPSWLPIEKPLFGADPGLKVEFPASEQERRTLPNGAEFFGARVVVKNDARETKTVPPLLIVLRDTRERVVYSWELVPPQRTLAPGEAMTINEAMTDVPKSAVYADIGWAPR